MMTLHVDPQWRGLKSRFARGKVPFMNLQHKLSAWIEKHSSQAAVAKAAECSESHLSLILSGERMLSYDLAKRLSEACNEEVLAAQIMAETDRIREEKRALQRARSASKRARARA